MVKPSRSRKRNSGAALLLSLWALFLLAGVVFAWALNINSRLTVSATANRVLSAEAMASSGAEVALNPTIQPASANLHKKMGNDGYDVEKKNETWVPLIKNVGSLEISYFDPNANDWLPRWPAGNRLPSLVKVSVGRPDAPDPWEAVIPLRRTPY